MRLARELYSVVNILKFTMDLWLYGSLYSPVEALCSPLGVCKPQSHCGGIWSCH